MTAPRTGRWTRALLALCLFSWPRALRTRDATALVQTVVDDLNTRTGRVEHGAILAAECASLLAAGARLRCTGLSHSLALGARGWRLDLRSTMRSLRRSPAFTVTVSLAIGVGVAANAVLFNIVDRGLFTPPSFQDPGALVFVWTTRGAAPPRFRVSAPDAAEIARRSSHLSETAFVSLPSDGGIEDTRGAGAEHVRIATVTRGLFDLLGTPPALGTTSEFRDAAASATDQDGGGVAILAHGAWRRVFGADPGVVGSTVRLNGRPIRLTAVMPPDFRIPMPPDVGMGGAVDVWLPLAMPLRDVRRTDGRQLDQDSDNTGAAIARLAPTVSLVDAADDLGRVATSLRAERPEYAAASVDFLVRPLLADSTAHLRGLLTGLLVAAVTLLFVTGLNISTLALARGERRQPEVALRRALGAGRAALLRHDVTEALALTLTGIGLALVFGAVFSAGASRLLPWELAGDPGGWSDPTALGVSLLVCTGALVLFGRAPTLSASETGRRLTPTKGRPDRRRVREALVVAQVALSVVVTLATVLLTEVARDLYSTEPGFDPSGAVTFSVSARAPGRYDGPADRARGMQRVVTALRERPGVTAVGLTGHLPLSGRRWTQPYGLPGQTEAEWMENRADFLTVSSGYIAALGVPILAGRSFDATEDLEERGRVAIVDEKLARRIAPPGRAVGSTLTIPLDGSIVTAEVVGVVGNVRHEGLVDDHREAIYVPYRQEASRDVTFVVRTGGDLPPLTSSIRDAIREVDVQLPVYGLRTLADYVDDVVAPTRFTLGVLGACALLVLLSVAIGLYGVIALEVSRRTREIGVRMAVGARGDSILRTILGRGARLTGAGLMAGALISVSLSRVLRSFAPGVSISDPILWLGATAAVAAVAMLASWLPARRASRFDPTRALRSD